jgi:multicomponent Na+:H+ antiporter subunit D
MFIWQGLIIGIFLARDFFNVFVMLEVATLVVVVLIMYVREKRSIFDGLLFLMINTAAIQFYLFGVGYVYMLAGAVDMDTVAETFATMEASQLILPYTLIMTGIAFKCALVPLTSWLPKIQAIPRAPTAVSAILSGLHVKCAVFLFIRVQEVFAPIATSEFFMIIGIITAVGSIIMALVQTDIKLILAYSSTAQIGLIMTGLNIGGEYAISGSLYHIINHAIFKAALFLSAGMVVRMYKTRDIGKISGLFKRSPLLSITTLLAILGITGAPLFNGSISKYFMMAEASTPMFWIMAVINLGTIIVYIRYSTMLFGADTSIPAVSIEGNKQVAMAILGVMTLCMGIFGEWLVRFLFGTDVSLSLWGYLEKAATFAGSLLVGIGLYHLLRHLNSRTMLIAGVSERLRGARASFRGMCVSIGIFFVIMLGFLGVFL